MKKFNAIQWQQESIINNLDVVSPIITNVKQNPPKTPKIKSK
jgi:hypothetical protein